MANHSYLIHLESNGVYKIKQIDGEPSLKMFQSMVGGYIEIDLFSEFDKILSIKEGDTRRCDVVLNEDGYCKKLPINKFLPQYRGDVVLALLDIESGIYVGFSETEIELIKPLLIIR